MSRRFIISLLVLGILLRKFITVDFGGVTE
jgi:hypothetical protein